MTNKERFIAALNGQPVDRLPCIEWATWWDKTIDRWRAEDATCPSDKYELFKYFGLDMHEQFWWPNNDGNLPAAKHHGAGLFNGEQAYRQYIEPHLFPDRNIIELREQLKACKARHDSGESVVWYTLEGFFWFPRTLFGIEEHLYAFYDEPDLMLEINDRLANYHLKCLECVYDVLTPEFMTFAEDMSYNHGPMISKELYDRFMLPFYKRVIPVIKSQGTKVLIDSDGDITELIPWFMEAGIEGILPLERMAGVDVNDIRQRYPDWIMIGGFDKTIMHLGEDAIKSEFERLLPTVHSGRYIPSVDHQTPPGVSIHDYRKYAQFLRQYCYR